MTLGRPVRAGSGTAIRPSFPLRRPVALASLLCVAVFATVVRAAGDTPATIGIPGPTSSLAAQQEAIRAIPWKELGERERHAIKHVVQNVTIYRRLPTRVIDCDPDLFTFLAQHPEVMVDTWRVLGISKVSLRRVGDRSFRANDGAGTTGRFGFVYSDWGADADNLVLVYARGRYDGKPLPGEIGARCVLLMRSGAVHEVNGRTYITVQFDSFVALDRFDIDLLAKTIRPWIDRTADKNFIETLSFVTQFSRAAERDPTGMEKFATQLTRVDEPTRAELVRLCRQTADRYARTDPAPLHLVRAEPESPDQIP